MKRFLGYFAEIVLSCIYPPVYRAIVRRSALSAFVYFCLFTTLYGLAASWIATDWLQEHFEPTLQFVEKRIPEVQVRMNGGRFSASIPQPIAFGDIDFAVVLNTTDTTGAEQNLTPYKSFLLITGTKAVFKKNAFETREYRFEAIPDFSLTSSDAIGFLKQHKEMIVWGFFWFLFLGLFPLAWLFVLPGIFVFAIFLLVLSKILRARLRYGQVLSIALYAITPPTIATTLLSLQGKNIPWLFLGL